jgi:arabinose-5-phosphate isomerase
LKTIAVVGRKGCSLGEFADCRIDASVKEEACPLNLSPTSSVIVALALGDALAACLMRRRGFTEEDYSRLHPSGSLGKKLLLRVNDLMHGGAELPQVMTGTTMAETLYVLTSKAMGAVVVTDASRTLRGIYTDGDLKRTIGLGKDFLSVNVDAVMTAGPVAIREDRLAVEALALMENRPSQISVLPVVDRENRVVGILRLHDLVRAGL